MTLTKDMIDLLTLIRGRAKSEGLGILRLSDPELNAVLRDFRQRSQSSLTHQLIEAYFRMSEPDGPTSVAPVKNGVRYRGAVVHRDEASQPVDAPKKSVRMYRGRPVPA